MNFEYYLDKGIEWALFIVNFMIFSLINLQMEFNMEAFNFM